LIVLLLDQLPIDGARQNGLEVGIRFRPAGLGAIKFLGMDRFEPWQKLKTEQATEGESHLALSVRIDVVFLDLHLCIVA
jgi:hypothetical protein